MEEIQRNEQERAILVGLQLPSMSEHDFLSSLEELTGLAETAGATVSAQLVQKKERADSATYVGSGKVQELQQLIEELKPDTVIFDSELSPIQLRNLENKLDVKIIDRTLLILDIFSSRAKTREGMLQVELARLQYKLPRLTGKGKELSRQGGGIGARGAGEQKLELDRRHIRRRIDEIKQHLVEVKKHRELHRARRKKTGIPMISLVGYTNAGKSSLFNAIYLQSHPNEEIQVEAENKLFATLDTTTRQISLPSRKEVLLTDTVGFIQNLPHHLVAAFRSTLEESTEADLLLHVVDRSHEEYEKQMETVDEVLKELGAASIPTVVVFNKMDRIEEAGYLSADIAPVSATTGKGIEPLLQIMDDKLHTLQIDLHLLVPYNSSSLMSSLHRQGEVVDKLELDEGWDVRVRLNEENYGRLRKELEPFMQH